MMGEQLVIPLFPPDIMERVRAAHALIEMEKLRLENKHLKHVRAGYMGSYSKKKK
jgi:hypothetical protein